MIYIVEDDINIRELETYALNNSGYGVMSFSDGKELFEQLEEQLPSLIILDIMLPGDDGLEILKKLRKDPKSRMIPVIMVTAKTSEIDAVKGLDAGADDYITKPFGVMEFISRIKAVLRRYDKFKEDDLLVFEEIIIDDKKREVKVDGKVGEFTFKEYELLKYLINNIGIVLSRNKMMDYVWGADYAGESRTVDMHIKALRQKLGIHGYYIKTVRNVGYKMEV